MKEHPILFKGELVRAILDGRKTVTRRPLKNQMTDGWRLHPEIPLATIGNRHPKKGKFGAFIRRELSPGSGKFEHDIIPCPYGKPGDRLWVRETFAMLGNEDGVAIDWRDNMIKGDEREAARIYQASCSVGDYGLWQIPNNADWKPDTDGMLYEGAWRPSIHMPRWAARILLEVTDVRVERLQDITEEQAEAEGAKAWGFDFASGCECELLDWPMTDSTPFRNGFAMLWESTGAKWADNPWVWVVSFKRVDQAAVSGV